MYNEPGLPRYKQNTFVDSWGLFFESAKSPDFEDLWKF